MNTNWVKIFVNLAGAILLAAGLSRLLIAAEGAQFLSLPDPALGIPLHYALLVVGGIESLVALICLFGKRIHFQVGWLAWLATSYLVFQIGLFWMHCHPQATCIGSLTDPLHLSRGIAGWFVMALTIYIILGSYIALIRLWANGTADVPVGQSPPLPAPADSIKMSCAACGGRVQFTAADAGQKIPCPHCQREMVLQAGNLKMTCVLCGGHIEFPVYVVGQKIPCPHCARTITLLQPP